MEDFLEEVTFEKRPMGTYGVTYSDIWGRLFQAKGTARNKSPDAG